MKIIPECINKTKRHLCASGSILLPLAQKWGLVGVLTICAISGVMAQNVSAATITMEVPSTLSLTVAPDGKLHASSPATVKITSDAYAGYTFTIKSNDTSNALKTTNERTIESIDVAAGTNDFPLNHWGFLPSKFNSQENTQYQPGPTDEAVTIDKTNPKSSSNSTTSYTITLGVKVDNETSAGTYSHNFILTATANDVPYTITYHMNEGTGISTLQNGDLPEGDSIEISKAPTRAGYNFAGWCEQATTNETCGGKVYQPGETYTLGNSDNALDLYAIWAQKMQDWKGCNALGDKIAYLVDSRDNNIYTVAKLKDGNCWMTQNLRLGKVGETMLLTSADSDVENNFTLPESNISKFYLRDYGDYTSRQPEEYDNDAVYLDPVQVKKYGGYYTWHTAVAGSGDHTTLNKDAQSSICPKGWKLPSENIYRTFGEYYPTPNTFINESVAGFVLGGSIGTRRDAEGREAIGGQNTSGFYWSSTAKNYSASAFEFNFTASSINWNPNMNRFDGRSVRCYARQ